MLSLLYVSRAQLSGGESHSHLRDILDRAVRRNLAAGITGALVFTGSDFAQVLEGDEAELEQLMASISADRRHEDVRIVKREDVSRRSFPNWGMALIGHMPDTQQQIDQIWRAADERSQDSAVTNLMGWMRQGASARINP